MNTIFVIGSNSFSGASFVDFALSKGARVIGISRSNEATPEFLPYKWQDYDNFTFQQLDLNKDLPAITSVIREAKPAYVVNQVCGIAFRAQ